MVHTRDVTYADVWHDLYVRITGDSDTSLASCWGFVNDIHIHNTHTQHTHTQHTYTTHTWHTRVTRLACINDMRAKSVRRIINDMYWSCSWHTRVIWLTPMNHTNHRRYRHIINYTSWHTRVTWLTQTHTYESKVIQTHAQSHVHPNVISSFSNLNRW